MQRLLAGAAALVILAGATSGAVAQPRHDDRHDNHGPSVHHDWRQGGRIDHNDWNRGARVDYRSHHLRAPPRGYEWRQVDGNYVLAAAATGLIASVLLANH